ncbi:MAG TPA: DNA ligase D [Allosphingosinicella sp.]|jgi:bifunctional non-homologous end joining protein LigD
MPTFVPPMLPTLVDAPPEGEEWLHELKYDGFRTQIAIGAGGEARAFTRAGHDWTDRYRPLVAAAAALGADEALVDGEVIVQDEQGRSDFGALQAAIARTPERLVFMAFDLIRLDGRDLRAAPVEERRARLQALIGANDPAFPIQFSAHVDGGGGDFFHAVDAMGLEGIVSKRKGSRYRSGHARSWLKAKTFGEGEFVVVAVERGDKAPVAILAREGEAGLELAGPAMVTLADPERERFWSTIETLKTDRPAVEMEKRRQGSFVEPRLRVRARHLRGEETLRHATVLAIVEARDAAAASPRPIPGTTRPGGEPSYKKPKLPEKAALVAYYRTVAPLLLEHAARRPLNLFRCTAGHCFFQRNRNHPASGDAFGAAIRFLPIAQKNGRTEDYLWVDDEAGVEACAEADAVEFHGWGSLVGDIEKPDRIAFDLDPGEGLGFGAVKDAALTLRRVLDEIGLESFPLLSGGKGVHVVVPLIPEAEWDAVREFARRICAALAGADPDRFTVALPKAERKGRIFLDFLRNQRTATAVLPFSLRARPGAPVAAPVGWDELPDLPRASRFTIADANTLLRRARSRALRRWGKARQRLPKTV